MAQIMTQNCQFSFQAQELPQKLVESIQKGGSGYWRHQFARLSGREKPFYWHVGVGNGKIFYSGGTPWSTDTLMKVVQRYIPRTHNEAVKQHFNLLQKDAQTRSAPPTQVIEQMGRMGILDLHQLADALRLKILNDLDTYLLIGAGESELISAEALQVQFPIAGFDAQKLMDEAVQRQFLWYQLKQQVPSMNLLPILKEETWQKATIPTAQREQIQQLVQLAKPLSHIATGLAKDNLEIAKIFAKLVKANLVRLEPPQQSTPSTIMIIDDSPLVLMQFQHWVTTLGYPVVVCQNAETALATILQVKPKAIFLDINMPNISGFELAKKIRQQPQVASTPLVILTGEQKLSNKWRAQWSGCDFLTKPLVATEVSQFQIQLQELLQKLVTGVTPTISTES